jgi:hypothetical protein
MRTWSGFHLHELIIFGLVQPPPSLSFVAHTAALTVTLGKQQNTHEATRVNSALQLAFECTACPHEVDATSAMVLSSGSYPTAEPVIGCPDRSTHSDTRAVTTYTCGQLCTVCCALVFACDVCPPAVDVICML